MKKRSIGKIILRVIIGLFAAVALFVLAVFIIHRVKTAKEVSLLKEKGYYNPVSVGD